MCVDRLADDFDVLIGAEGAVRLRHAPTSGLAALADVDDWRYAFALIQGGELFVKDLPERQIPSRPTAAVAGAAPAGGSDSGGLGAAKEATGPRRVRRIRRTKSLELPRRPQPLPDTDVGDQSPLPPHRVVPRSKSVALGLTPSILDDDDEEDEDDGEDGDEKGSGRPQRTPPKAAAAPERKPLAAAASAAYQATAYVDRSPWPAALDRVH